MQLRFVATTGQGSFQGDIAIDNLRFTAGTTIYIYNNGWTPANPSGIATELDDIQVIAGIAQLTADTSINDVTVVTGATLDLGNTSLSVNGNYVNNGTTDAASATMIMNGATQQNISGNLIEIGNLEINSSDLVQGVVIDSPVIVNTSLSLDNGVLTTGGNITLSSSAAGTAMIDTVLNGTIVGDVTVERFIPARRAFRLVSSTVTTTTSINQNWQEGVNNTGTTTGDNTNPNPGFGTHITGSTSGANGFDATASGNPSLFVLDNEAQSWGEISNTNINTFTAGTPYRLFVRGDRSIDVTSNAATATNTVLRTTGEITTGLISFTGTTLNQNAGSFNFIGNPYQAAVNINDVLGSSSNTDTDKFYVWDPTLGARGMYVTVSLDGTGSTNAATSKNYHFVQPGQAIFVRTTATVTDGSTAIRFNETDKVMGENIAVFNSNQAYAQDARIIGRLYRSDRYGQDAGLQDSFVILYNEEYQNELNSKDAPKLYNQDENMGILQDGVILSIEKRSLPQEEEEVRFFNALYKVNDYTLDLEVNNITGVTPYLIDTYLETSTELFSGLNTVTFTVDQQVEGSVASDRFKIVYGEESLSVVGQNLINLAIYPNPVTDGTFTISSSDLTGEIGIELYNILGQKVYTSTENVINNRVLVTPDTTLGSGVYLLEITTENAKITKKLIVK